MNMVPQLIIGDGVSQLTCKQALLKIEEDVYITCNGRIVVGDEVLESGRIYRICQRLRGGKGGFGSMLRTIGAQIEKTTNRESMRDLSGRRMRDINNEKKLADWVAGAADRERARDEKRQERLDKRKAEAEGRMHKFRDEQYMEQKEAVTTNLDDALTQGLKRSAATGSTSAPVRKKGKGKAPATSMMMGMGVDIDDLSSSEDEDNTTQPLPQSSDDSVTGSAEALPEIIDASTSQTKPHEETAESETVRSTESNDQNPTDENTAKSAETESLTESPSKIESGAGAKTESQDTKVNHPIDLDSHKSADELEEYGLEHLKKELMRRGLKCGGSLQERSARLYSVRGLLKDEIDPSLFAKKGKAKKQ